MEKLFNVKDIMERYGCSRQTAIRYIQKLEHLEKPYAVRESVLREWELSRTVRPPEVVRAEMVRRRFLRKEGANGRVWKGIEGTA